MRGSKRTSLILAIFLLLLTQLAINFFVPKIDALNFSPSIKQTRESNPLDHSFYPNQGQYNAELHWVKTNISINKRGTGKVAMLINCTPNADHFGIYLRAIEEEHSLLLDETYALQDGEELALNATRAEGFDVSYQIYLENTSRIQPGKTLLYRITYESNFYFSNQLGHYAVNPELAFLDLTRPYWDEPLDFRIVRINLPVEVASPSVSNSTLEEAQFQVEEFMNDYYQLAFYGEKNNAGNYYLVFETRKDDLQARATFEINCYLSMEYFSFPMVINWLVIVLVLLFTIVSLILFLFVIDFKNKSLKENKEFKEKLYALAARAEDSEK
ncbi:MAG: hypothetical protein GF308_14925 [Candidatus Heimdallarchaeota archaeon]|nr:hypothetical protein [Candidatus Heimdallarchaeota archaeon]